MLVDATLRILEKHIELYERAAAFDARPRERMLAVAEADELFFRLHPRHYRALQTVRVASQLGRTTNLRRDAIRRCESRLVGLVMQVMHEGIACGDLPWDRDQRPEELAFAVWALAFGTRALMDTAVVTTQLGIHDGYPVGCDTLALLFDALGWQPLSSEWNYQTTLQRIRTELFPSEWHQASAA